MLEVTVECTRVDVETVGFDLTKIGLVKQLPMVALDLDYIKTIATNKNNE